MDKKDPNHPLAAIVCGYERGGTTLVSEILRQNPKLFSGFECGFLLAENISDFLNLEPYCSMTKTGWELSDNDLKYVCEASDWLNIYERLKEKLKLTKDKDDILLFDKTPKYMQKLSSVLDKVPGVKCIAVLRDPRSVLWSWAKRSQLSLEDWLETELDNSCKRYNSYARGLNKALDSELGNRILKVQYEELCLNKVQVSEEIFNFLGLEFKESFLLFDGKKFGNVYGNSISSQHLTEYKNNFQKKHCQTIVEKTSDFVDWFWYK